MARGESSGDFRGDLFESLEYLKREGEALLRAFSRANPSVVYADLRFEVVFNRAAAAVNGEPRDGSESETAAYAISVHAAHGGAIGLGQTGAEIGRFALRRAALIAEIRRGLAEAFARARFSAREKAAAVKSLGRAAGGLISLPLPPRPPVRATVDAIFARDPRGLSTDELKKLANDASKEVLALGDTIAYQVVAAMTELRHEIFLDTAGSVIAQAFAFSQGDCYVVAQSGDGHQENYDTIGQQRGLECLSDGWRGELMPNPDLAHFAVALARETAEVAAAPVLRPPDSEVVVVTDPHFNALVAHEVIGHPCEADRALKMEAAYAGRSWFLRSLRENQLGKAVASPILSACSDPTLDGYGHYRYDHEGTAGRRVTHIDRGVFSGFLNSRATAHLLDAAPNGSARASEGWHVPLIRMSNTFFLPGETPPAAIIADVERGYYVCGHHTPSIAESRENFRISARRVYEIDHGRIGRLYRAGSVISDSKNFFMNVDAVGNDLRLVAIPNCGKGQPMQVKRMSNGGPTMRSRARLGGG